MPIGIGEAGNGGSRFKSAKQLSMACASPLNVIFTCIPYCKRFE